MKPWPMKVDVERNSQTGFEGDGHHLGNRQYLQSGFQGRKKGELSVYTARSKHKRRGQTKTKATQLKVNLCCILKH